AALEVLAADPAPAPHRVRFLDALLTSQEARPRYAETLLVHRLALLARDPGPGGWSSEHARLLVELTRDFQALAALPDAAAVLQGRLDALAQQRHDAEALVFAPGYAPAADADRALRRAATAARELRRVAEVLRLARQSLDESLAVLPAATAAVEHDPRL